MDIMTASDRYHAWLWIPDGMVGAASLPRDEAWMVWAVLSVHPCPGEWDPE